MALREENAGALQNVPNSLPLLENDFVLQRHSIGQNGIRNEKVHIQIWFHPKKKKKKKEKWRAFHRTESKARCVWKLWKKRGDSTGKREMAWLLGALLFWLQLSLGEQTVGDGFWPRIGAAAAAFEAGRLWEAKERYEEILRLGGFQDSKVAAGIKNNFGRVLLDLGDLDGALAVLENAMNVMQEVCENSTEAWQDEFFAKVWTNVGLSHHRKGSCCETEAIEAFSKALRYNDKSSEAWFNFGTSAKNLGRMDIAFEAFKRSLEIDADFTPALLNLAALFHENHHLDEAIETYARVLSLESNPWSSLRQMALMNGGVALVEKGNAEQAVSLFDVAWREANNSRERDQDFDIHVRMQIALARLVVCDWTDFHDETNWIAENVFRRQVLQSRKCSILPFDSLLFPSTAKFRKEVAKCHARQFSSSGQESRKIRKTQEKLRVGYASCDFGDHPTAHLVEGLFGQHSTTEAFVLSFGKESGGEFRERIKNDAGENFVDLLLKPHADAARMIRDRLKIDILMDMQGFTRGGRPDVLRLRPASIIVNYLVFPGTSGADYVDYFVGDRFASPLAESWSHFTEKLVILPHSYQVTSYHSFEGYSNFACPKELQNASFVFANFNKNDKIEPEAFDAWMEILRRVQGSVLWLLKPSRKQAFDSVQKNLRRESSQLGVAPDRIVFAERVPKAEHVVRHRFADLFLDTFVYGAHSTATDALRGGLPVLTLQGSSFANRVAASLLQNVGLPELITFSKREFVETAVRIASSRTNLVSSLKARLHSHLAWKTTSPLFDPLLYAKHLEEALESMAELQVISKSARHIIILPETSQEPANKQGQ